MGNILHAYACHLSQNMLLVLWHSSSSDFKIYRKISFQKATPYVCCEYMFMCSCLCVLNHVPYNKTEDKDYKNT